MSTYKVNWADLETAFERNAPGLTSYIDKSTGAVIAVMEESPEDAEKRKRLAENPTAYVKVEPASSREQYRWMENFVATTQEDALRDRLLVAIDGKGAFRRFKDVLLAYPAERERWFEYRSAWLRYHINRWFETRGDTPDPPPPWGDVLCPPEPDTTGLKKGTQSQGPAEQLRAQIKRLADLLPAGDLHAAQVFLEFLRDRGSAALDGTRAPLDPHKPFRRPDGSQGGRGEDHYGDLAEGAG